MCKSIVEGVDVRVEQTITSWKSRLLDVATPKREDLPSDHDRLYSDEDLCGQR